MMSKMTLVLAMILFIDITQLCCADEKANLENLERSEQVQCKVKNASGSEAVIDDVTASLRVSNDEREKLQSELSQLNSTLQQFLCAFDDTHRDILHICKDIYINKCDVRCCDVQTAIKMSMENLVHASNMISELLANLSECKDFTNMQSLQSEKMYIDHILEDPEASILSAVTVGDTDRLRCILNSIATNVNIKYENDWTLLAVAAIYNSTEIVKLLLNAGANIDDRNSYDTASMMHGSSHMISYGEKRLRIVDGANATALIVAAFKNHTEICKILLEAGAAPDIQNEMGRTALMYAVQNENLGLIKMLLDKGVNVEATTKEEGYTALHIASFLYRSSVEMLKLLVSHNANINAKNMMGETPLTVAWEYRNRETFIYLLKLGAEE